MCHHCARQLAISAPPPATPGPPLRNRFKFLQSPNSPNVERDPRSSLQSKKGTNVKRKLLILSTCWRRPATLRKRCQRGSCPRRCCGSPVEAENSRVLPQEKGPGPLQALSKHRPSEQSQRTFLGVLISFPLILYRTLLSPLKTKAQLLSSRGNPPKSLSIPLF